MESLVRGIAGLRLEAQSQLIWYNNCDYELFCIGDEWQDKVFTNERIAKGSLIGMLEGALVNTRALVQDKYCVWLSDYELLDCRSTPRCILSMVREGFYEGIEANCKMGVSYMGEGVCAYVYAVRDIEAGEELFMDKEFY